MSSIYGQWMRKTGANHENRAYTIWVSLRLLAPRSSDDCWGYDHLPAKGTAVESGVVTALVLTSRHDKLHMFSQQAG